MSLGTQDMFGRVLDGNRKAAMSKVLPYLSNTSSDCTKYDANAAAVVAVLIQMGRMDEAQTAATRFLKIQNLYATTAQPQTGNNVNPSQPINGQATGQPQVQA